MRNEVTVNAPVPRKSHLGMPYALGKFADVKFYGPGFPDCPTLLALRGGVRIDVLKVIKKLYGDDYPDVVIQRNPFYHVLRANGEGLWSVLANFHLAKCLRVLWLHDLHNTFMYMPTVFEYIKKRKVDVVIKYWDVQNRGKWSQKLATAGVPVEWCSFSIDPNIFYDRKLPKIHDVTTIGVKDQTYPVRVKINEILKRHPEIKHYSGGSVWRNAYAKVINETKIFATGCSSYTVILQKIFEVMACNTLLLCNVPFDANELGLKPNINFVAINYNPQLKAQRPTDDMILKPLRYYLQHPEEAKKIAQRGHDLVHSRHTHKIRMKELVDKLSKYL